MKKGEENGRKSQASSQFCRENGLNFSSAFSLADDTLMYDLGYLFNFIKQILKAWMF